MDASLPADRLRSLGGVGLMKGASQSTASSAKVEVRSTHLQTEAPKWIVRRMAWTLQRT
jgi:hypothetical protein